MPKRKVSENYTNEDNDDIVPIPIQFFFWNQTSMFIKQKFGNLTEAHAMNFEKVIVQNILHGLSPGLSDAINSISRWAFIKASFPHIMHACAAALIYRKEKSPGQKLSKTETKLLYTLHWLILDAASECEDNAIASSVKLVSGNKPPTSVAKSIFLSKSSTRPAVDERTQASYLHSVATIQLFVYLFIPILDSLNASDLDNLKLSNGLKIWQPLWSHRQPSIKIFNTPVKQKYHIASDTNLVNSDDKSNDDEISLVNNLSQKPVTTTGNIYVGKNATLMATSNILKSSSFLENMNGKLDGATNVISEAPSQYSLLNTENSTSVAANKPDKIDEYDSIQISDFDTDTIRDSIHVLSETAKTTPSSNASATPVARSSVGVASAKKAPLVHMHSICSFSDNSSTPSFLKSSDGETLAFYCSKCNAVINNLKPASIPVCPHCSTPVKLNGEGKASPSSSLSLIIEGKSSKLIDLANRSNRLMNNSRAGKLNKLEQRDVEAEKPTNEPETNLRSSGKFSHKKFKTNIRDATFFDVAVMRCLVSPKWHANGYLWALEYLNCRVTEITDYTLKEKDEYFRVRSTSLPSNLNYLCILMGVDSTDIAESTKNLAFDLEKLYSQKQKFNYTNEFIELMNQIYFENDFFNNKKSSYCNVTDYVKRRKYEASFQARISSPYGNLAYFKNGRMKYIDEDLQNICRRVSTRIKDKKSQQIPTTPFTANELQSLNLNTNSFMDKLKQDVNHNLPTYSMRLNHHKSNDWLNSDFDQKLNQLKRKVTQIEKQRKQKQQLPNNNRPVTNLNRVHSYSDSNIYYQASYEETEEACGSAGLINIDGSLNLNMILKGAHSVLLKENSIKLCELSLNILENLISIDLLPSEEIDEKLEQARAKLTLSQSTHVYLNDLEKKYSENFHLATDLALRNIKWLGCIHCQSSSKSFQNDQLRGKVKLLLNRLNNKNPKRFKAFLQTFIRTSDINHLVETFHAMLGFCYDPLSGYGHYYPHVTIRVNSQRVPQKNSFYDTKISNQETNAFNIESLVMEIILKPLVERLIEMKSNLTSQENLYLFSEIRNFLSYIKENHGGIFRKLAFSAMLESYIKLNQDINKKSQKLKEIDERLNELNKIKVHMSNLKENPTVSLAYSRMGSQVNTDTAPTPPQPTDEGTENIRPTTSRMLSEQSASSRGFKKQSMFKLFGSKSNLDNDSNQVNINVENESIKLDTLVVNINPSASRRASETSIRKINVKKSIKESFIAMEVINRGNMTSSMLNNDEHADTSTIRADDADEEAKRRNKSTNEFNQEDQRSIKTNTLRVRESSKHDLLSKDIDYVDFESLQELYEQAMATRRAISSEKCLINSRIIFKGIEYYRFLMECLPPASLPDVPFMSALLELDAPIVSKAAFLLETAYFINRCNRKDWPEWIKMNIGIYRPYGSFASYKNMPNAVKRNRIYQLAAANIFAAWGEVLANKIESILAEKEYSLAEAIHSPEDFFDDKLVNPTGNNCPFGLLNIVCLVLFEITKFIRETYQYMPKKVSNSSNYRAEFPNRQRAGGEYRAKESAPRAANFFPNESNNFSMSTMKEAPTASYNFTSQAGNQQQKPETSNRMSSNENLSMTMNDNEQNSEVNMKHITFAGLKDNEPAYNSNTNINQMSTFETESSDFNFNRLSAGAVMSKTGTARHDDSGKSGSITHISQSKRNSIKASSRRPSLKYRTDHRAHRNAMSSMNGAGGVSFRRKLSHGNSLSFFTSEALSHEYEIGSNFQSAAQQPTSPDDVLIISEEVSLPNANLNSPSAHNGAVSFGPLSPTFTQISDGGSQLNEYCEVDEIDFNRSFPWIKVTVKLLTCINYSCNHSFQTINQQKSRRSLLYDNCCKDCYLRLFKNSHNLIEAVLRMYETSRNSNLFEKYESQVKAKSSKENQTKANEEAFNSQHSSKIRKNSQSSFNSQRIFFINNILKKSNNIKSLTVLAPINIILAANNRKLSSMNGHVNFPMSKNIEKIPTIDYTYNQVHYLNQIPLLILCKSILVMSDDLFTDVIKISWNLLLNSDQEISSSAASLFLIGATKQQNFVEELIRNEFSNKSVDLRYKAILKFETLWKFRYHVWPHLENNAHNLLKISPPCIEFVLPSPPIGVPFVQPVDPPWMPKAKTKVEEVTINQEEVRAVVTASKSRKKHQQEKIYKALELDQLNKKKAREHFYFTNLGYLHHASIEPFLFQSKEEVEEGNEENMEINATNTANEVQQSQPIFPTSVSSAALSLIDLLNDHELNSNNQSVSSVAYRIVWTCLTEDATLFLRYFFEKITQKDKKNLLIQYLRRLISAYVDFPPQTAYIFINYLLGVVMYFVRSPNEGSQEAVSSILTLIWRVVSSVNGIVFKDLKQTLRKEQCDPSLLITANLPSAKNLIVHGPDLSQIPTQFPIYDNTQFSYIIQESFGFFKIPESKKDKYYLIDIKTNQIHTPDSYVRNFYFFRRNFYPQLSLVEMDPKEATKLLEKAAFNLKVLEQSKVLFFRKLLDNAPYNQANTTAAFLHDELSKLPMFPRKALEADFSIFPRIMDRELLTTDMLHKYSWCQLIWSLFSSISSKTASTWDITLFLSVINGSFLLHCEDLNTIRTCLAIYLNSAQHFQHIFATNGFLLIMPTLMKIYSNMQSNVLLKNAIEFTCLQFYIMHRIPFILQLFGSVAQILDTNGEKTNIIDTTKVQSSCLFSLLHAMESNLTDNLKILDLVRVNINETSGSTGATNTANFQNTYAVANQTSSLAEQASRSQYAENIEKQTLPNQPLLFANTNFSSPASLLTNAGSSSAVLAVSGIQATNLLITSSGALGIGQLASLNAATSTAVNPNLPNMGQTLLSTQMSTPGPDATDPLNQSAGAKAPPIPPNLGPAPNAPIAPVPMGINDRNLIKALDFCYSDDQTIKFNIVDAINLCVTVVAYATHAYRSTQMLIILDVLIPRYLNKIKEETETLISNHKLMMSSGFASSSGPSSAGLGSPMSPTGGLTAAAGLGLPTGDKQPTNASQYHLETMQQAKNEFNLIQKLSVSIKTLVNTSDFLARIYSGPKMDNINFANKTNTNNKNSTNRSPSIMPDEDSMRFAEEKRPRQTDSIEDIQIRQEFRSPRDCLLNIVSMFVFYSSKRIKELYKIINDTSLKVAELLDTKAHCRLVEIANALLKLWDDSSILSGNGLQNYFQKLLPVTDWSEEELKPAFNNLLRRIDRVFTKISKRPPSKIVDWAAIAGFLNGLFLTLDKQDFVAHLPIFKMLINSTISLILNETSTDFSLLNSINLSSSKNTEFTPPIPIVFSKTLIKLVGKYINCLKDQSNLEQLFGASNTNPIAPTMPSGLAYLINFLLPLLFWSASDRKDSPKLNTSDISFVVTILLNALKPPSKLAATLLLQAPKQHHLISAFDNSISANNKSSKQLKDVLTQTTFLALKLVVFSFNKQIELTRVATALKQMCIKAKNIFLWKFLDFITTNRTSLFLILKPFIENFVESQNCENDLENQIRLAIRAKLNCSVLTNFKCNNVVLNELIDELNGIKLELMIDTKTEAKTTNLSPNVSVDIDPNNLTVGAASTSAAATSAEANQTDKSDGAEIPLPFSNKDKDTVQSPAASAKSGTGKSNETSTSNVQSPNRNVSFKLSKLKKDSSSPSGQYTLVSAVPRKKMDKLNYKTGASILEIYKARYKEKFLKNSEAFKENVNSQEVKIQSDYASKIVELESINSKLPSFELNRERKGTVKFAMTSTLSETTNTETKNPTNEQANKTDHTTTINETSTAQPNGKKEKHSKLKKVIYI